jgi:hypothetical protein
MNTERRFFERAAASVDEGTWPTVCVRVVAVV